MSVPTEGRFAARGTENQPSRWALGLLAVAGLLALWIRIQLSFDDFANPDIGGIAYNADLIAAGGLPWIDSREFKAQGAAFLWAIAWAIGGRSVLTVQVLYGFWIVLGALATGAAAQWLWADERVPGRGGLSNAACLAAALHLWMASHFDFNYAAWMTTPYACAFAALIGALRFRSRAGALLGGAALMFAILCKQHAALLAPLLFLAPVFLRARDDRDARPSSADATGTSATQVTPASPRADRSCREPLPMLGLLVLVMTGALIVLAPLVIWYGVRAGEPLRPITALLPWDAIWEYSGGSPGVGASGAAGNSSLSSNPTVSPATDGVAPGGPGGGLILAVALQQLRVFPLAYAAILAAWLLRLMPTSPLATASVPSRDVHRDARIVAFAFWALSVGACSLGGNRFYLHYLVQEVPALAVLAADPRLSGTLEALAYRPPRRQGGRGRMSALLLAVGGLLAAGLALHGRDLIRGEAHRYDVFPRRLTGGATPAQSIGGYIHEHSAPDETIQVWGWSAWTVYYWADRRAPSPVYKPMGVLTEFNRDSAFATGDDLRLRPGPALDRFIESFRAAPPRYFVYSPSYVTTFGARHDPLEDFHELLAELRTHYRRVGQFGDLVLFEDQRPRAKAGGQVPQDGATPTSEPTPTAESSPTPTSTGTGAATPIQ